MILLVQLTCQLHVVAIWSKGQSREQVRTRGCQNVDLANVLEGLFGEYHPSSVALDRQHPDVTQQHQTTIVCGCWVKSGRCLPVLLMRGYSPNGLLAHSQSLHLMTCCPYLAVLFYGDQAPLFQKATACNRRTSCTNSITSLYG